MKSKQFTILYFQFTCALLMVSLMNPIAQAQSRGIGIQTAVKSEASKIRNGIYHALIIGNNEYYDDKGIWQSLKTAIKDARAIKQVLQTKYGFTDIKLLENATRKDVLVELDALSRRISSEDHVLVYYAGHGFVDTETNRGYWVPVDASGTDKTTYLRNSTIRDEITVLASRAKHTLLISDSCFSGTLLRRGMSGIRPNYNTKNYYQKVSNKKSVQIMSAGGFEFVDDSYLSSGHSPFSYFLLNELNKNDQSLLAVSELSSSVTKAVANNVDQVPQSGILQGAGDELGEFIFIRVDVKVSGVKKENVKIQVNKVDVDVIESNSKRDKILHKHLPLPTL